MRFLSMVKADADSEAGVMPDPQLFVEMGKLSEEMRRKGVLLSEDGLAPSSQGARVKFKSRVATVVDGPFTESKELVAGFAILKLGSLEEAIEGAKLLPIKARIEIRQIFDDEELAAIEGFDVAAEQAQRAKLSALSPGKRRFMFLIKSNADAESGHLPNLEVIEEMGRYNQQLIDAGLLLAGEGLHGSDKGARVDLETCTVTKGPFANPESLIAGFWSIQADSLADAIAWAKRAPIVDGEIEVRPYIEFGCVPAPSVTPNQQQATH